MGDISEHFNRSEFACKCGCGFDAVDVELLLVIEDARVHFNKPCHINSGCRCREHNEAVQKAANSNYVPYSSKSIHMKAKAADIWFDAVHPDNVAKYLEEKYPDKYGIGRYNGRTHVDVRMGKARWDNRVMEA